MVDSAPGVEGLGDGESGSGSGEVKKGLVAMIAVSDDDSMPRADNVEKQKG